MKETQEALIAVNEISLVIIERIKDGIQLGDDVTAIISKWSTDPVFAEKVKAGMAGIASVPAEIAKIDVMGAVGLATTQLAYVPKIVEALKKTA